MVYYNTCFADNRLFFSVKTADGTAGTVRHKMGGITSCHLAFSIRQKDGFIYTTRFVLTPDTVLIMEKYDIALDTLTLYSTSAISSMGFEPTGEMRIALWSSANTLEIAPIDLILVHRNVSASTLFTDIAIGASEFLLVSDTPRTYAVNSSVTWNTFTPTDVATTLTIDAANSYVEEVNIWESPVTFNDVAHASTLSLSAQVTCSSNTYPTITHTKVAYLTNPIPSWVTYNAVTGNFDMTTPTLTEATSYSFTLESTIVDDPTVYRKNVFINVVLCTVNNCMTWVDGDVNTWETWDDGFLLNANVCEEQEDETKTSGSSGGIKIWIIILVVVWGGIWLCCWCFCLVGVKCLYQRRSKKANLRLPEVMSESAPIKVSPKETEHLDTERHQGNVNININLNVNSEAEKKV